MYEVLLMSSITVPNPANGCFSNRSSRSREGCGGHGCHGGHVCHGGHGDICGYVARIIWPYIQLKTKKLGSLYSHLAIFLTTQSQKCDENPSKTTYKCPNVKQLSWAINY